MQLRELVIRCTRAGMYSCDYNLFEHQFNMHYQNCYTYRSPQVYNKGNSTTAAKKVYATLREGIENGWSSIVLAGRGALGAYENFNDPDTNYDNHIATVGLTDSAYSGKGQVGVRVVIHPPNTTALPMKEGFDVPPGFSASFAIQPKLTKRRGLPYSKCRESSSFNIQQHTEDSYRQQNCISEYIQGEIVKQCGCVDVRKPVLTDELKDRLSSTKPCIERNSTNNNETNGHGKNEKSLSIKHNKGVGMKDKQIKCMHQLYYCSQFRRFQAGEELNLDLLLYQAKESNKMTICSLLLSQDMDTHGKLSEISGCYPACHEYKYDISYSLSKWPSSGYEGLGLYTDIMNQLNYLLYRETLYSDAIGNSNRPTYEYYMYSNTSKVLEDFSQINVYVADNSILTTEEVPDYEFDELVSDIGGQLGIWIGVSFLTMTEVFEMIFNICHDSLSRRCRRSEHQKNDKSDEELDKTAIKEGDKEMSIVKL